MNLTRRYVRNPNVVERTVDDATFLVGADNKSLYHLNPLAAALWTLLADPISVNEACAVIHQAFPDAGRKNIRNDVAALISDLKTNDLVIIGKRPENTSRQR
ncbi:MAG: hypothetical protein A3G18_09970 [Rhodospirillales bacterium RIFCSPLOWO2_12_FULL_58_28]|nr:MAG: hypothetical protein A3H92_08145 [Rhodospirillales bacterium RIFCSPLOWO2_02_FULL_58_16]OHC77609.1 MAG: hypothetical protein A3G18_09970 [Rhodospirillales bacterium RIFCSPLOWO2_12_FULL_58_28]